MTIAGELVPPQLSPAATEVLAPKGERGLTQLFRMYSLIIVVQIQQRYVQWRRVQEKR